MPPPGYDYTESRRRGDIPDIPVGSVSKTINNVVNYARKIFSADDPMRAVYIKNAVQKMFKRYDRHVRLILLSRDVITDCKSIIMLLLHTPITTDSSEKTIAEAKERIQMVINGPIKKIGIENEHCPAILHHHAITGGFQEYVKARIMLSLIAENRIITYPEVQKELEYIIIDNDHQRLLVTKIPRSDYILGLAELSVELMTKAVNSVSNRDTEECFQTSDVLKQLYSGYLGITGQGYLNRKLPVTHANLQKVEQALLALRERYGAMRPYWMDAASPNASLNEYRRKYYGY